MLRVNIDALRENAWANEDPQFVDEDELWAEQCSDGNEALEEFLLNNVDKAQQEDVYEHDGEFFIGSKGFSEILKCLCDESVIFLSDNGRYIYKDKIFDESDIEDVLIDNEIIERHMC